jgi:hypothetical protein
MRRSNRAAVVDVVAAIAAVAGLVAGIAVESVGALMAATVDETPASASDQRRGAVVVVVGLLLALTGPVTLALRSRRIWPWVFPVLVVGFSALLIHRWPPELGYEF